MFPPWRKALILGFAIFIPLLAVLYYAMPGDQSLPVAAKNLPYQGDQSAVSNSLPLLPDADATHEDNPSFDETRQSMAFARQLLRGISSNNAQVQDAAFDGKLRAWVKRDASSAASFAAGLQEPALRDRAMRIVTQVWGSQDVGQAVEWGAKLASESERREAFYNICLGLAADEPGKGVLLADQLGLAGEERLANLTAQWAAKDQEGTLTWASQRPAGLERDQLMQRIAFAQAQSNPAQAATLIVDQIPAGDIQTEAVISVVSQWAIRDPRGASAWVESFPVGALRERAISEIRGVASIR